MSPPTSIMSNPTTPGNTHNKSINIAKQIRQSMTEESHTGTAAQTRLNTTTQTMRI